MKQMLLLLITELKYSNATERSVFLLDGLKEIISLIILKMCFLPFLGGINFSIISEKKITPTLSLFLIAEKAKTAPISVANSFLKFLFDPKLLDPETSIINITVISLSSSKTLTKGLL